MESPRRLRRRTQTAAMPGPVRRGSPAERFLGEKPMLSHHANWLPSYLTGLPRALAAALDRACLVFHWVLVVLV